MPRTGSMWLRSAVVCLCLLHPRAYTSNASVALPNWRPDTECRIACDFENDICSWHQTVTDVFDWTRQQGSTPTPSTGPSSDHTSGSGHYLYIEANEATYGDTARLRSSECPNPVPQCLEFWYHMYGSADTMGLTVYLQQGSSTQEVWSVRNNQGNLWLRALVDLRPEENYRIIFEGRRGANDRSDVAVDDVSLHRGTCADIALPRPTTVRPETPAPTTVRPETPAPTTVRPPQTTVAPETPAPTTVRPETPAPTTVRPETPAPTTVRPTQTTVRPETPAPTTVRPETPAPTTVRPPQTTVRPETPRPSPSCPRNSHYTDCVPACQPTCKHLHGQPGCNADEPCVQGCVCDDGFILKQRTCVPIRECGCQDDQGNKYYFDQVWYEDHCSRRCECEEEDGRGEIECDEEYECDDDDVCHMDEDGQFSCVSTDFSECSIDKDPEYRTFDHMKHEFDGEHSYVLVQTTRLPQNLPDVYVVGINNIMTDHDSDEDLDDDDNSSNRSNKDNDSEEDGNRGRMREMKIRVYNHMVVFKKNRKVVVDGAQVQLPVSPSAGLKIWKHASSFYLTTDFGLKVEFNINGKAEIVLPHTYKRKVGGLCGNFDGKQKNDMMKPDGKQAKSEKEFGESWRVTEERLLIRQKRSTLLRTITRA